MRGNETLEELYSTVRLQIIEQTLGDEAYGENIASDEAFDSYNYTVFRDLSIKLYYKNRLLPNNNEPIMNYFDKDDVYITVGKLPDKVIIVNLKYNGEDYIYDADLDADIHNLLEAVSEDTELPTKDLVIKSNDINSDINNDLHVPVFWLLKDLEDQDEIRGIIINTRSRTVTPVSRPTTTRKVTPVSRPTTTRAVTPVSRPTTTTRKVTPVSRPTTTRTVIPVSRPTTTTRPVTPVSRPTTTTIPTIQPTRSTPRQLIFDESIDTSKLEMYDEINYHPYTFEEAVARLYRLAKYNIFEHGDGYKSSFGISGTYRGKPFGIRDHKEDGEIYIDFDSNDFDFYDFEDDLLRRMQKVKPKPYRARFNYDTMDRYSYP
jgi:hypothetical protein